MSSRHADPLVCNPRDCHIPKFDFVNRKNLFLPLVRGEAEQSAIVHRRGVGVVTLNLRNE